MDMAGAVMCGGYVRAWAAAIADVVQRLAVISTLKECSGSGGEDSMSGSL